MRVKSIADSSKGSILQYFWPSLSYHLSLGSLFCLFLSGRFTQGLTVVTVYGLKTQQQLKKYSTLNLPPHLRTIFATSLDPKQAWQNVGPDLDLNCLTLWSYSWTFNFEKSAEDKKQLPSMQPIKYFLTGFTLLVSTPFTHLPNSPMLNIWLNMKNNCSMKKM